MRTDRREINGRILSNFSFERAYCLTRTRGNVWAVKEHDLQATYQPTPVRALVFTHVI